MRQSKGVNPQHKAVGYNKTSPLSLQGYGSKMCLTPLTRERNLTVTQ